MNLKYLAGNPLSAVTSAVVFMILNKWEAPWNHLKVPLSVLGEIDRILDNKN
jgi:hypothetical protein